MSKRHVILCGGSKQRGRQPNHHDVVKLSLSGAQNNVFLKISDISRKMVTNIPPLLLDLLEIATYVYCADQSVKRGGDKEIDFGQKWRRQLQFHIPVREPEVWKSDKVLQVLVETLGFLSDDDYDFRFSKVKKQTPVDQYFDLTENKATGFIPEEVLLFSGGLDSLAGTIKECISDGKKVVAVSHRSSPKVDSTQKALINEFSLRNDKPNFFHVPVWANNTNARAKEFTQRTRSFLFAALGAAIARMFKLDRIRFYENGVISMNLPISEQIVGALASRTTHPKVLDGYSRLFSLLFDRPFAVDNPFIWMTKTDVVERIGNSDCSQLIKYSNSCAHVWDQTKLHNHCGRCSQCIDRRFATLASGHAKNDPREMYAVDLLTGERETTEDRTMLQSYIKTAQEIETMSDNDFFSRYPEVFRIIPYLPGTVDEVAKNILDMYQRHAKQVGAVIEKAIKEMAGDIRHGELPDSCAIMVALPDKQLKKEDEDFTYSPDFRVVTLRGERFNLTPMQAAVCRVLYKDCAASDYEAGQEFLLETVGSTSQRLQDIFRSSPKAWGKLIVKGSKKGMFRLNL